MTSLHLSPWREQQSRWPAQGRHILAQYDEQMMVVCCPISIG